MKNKWVTYGMALGLALSASATSARAQFTETEPNDNKAGANAVGCLTAGSTITGNTTGTSTTVAGPASADNYLTTTCALPFGIYRHRLVITTAGTAGHTGTIRGLNQTDGPTGGVPGTTDTTVQTSSTLTTPPRYNQWYGFGKSEQLIYRVTGGVSTTADYVSTFETTQVTPVDIGSYQPGTIVISTHNQGHASDTDMWVYDGNLDAIPGYGNDDESIAGGGPGTTLQSILNRTYTPGTYYLALSNFQLANNQPSPEDDDFETGSLLDFPNAIANSSTTINLNLTFSITDSAGSVQIPNTKLSQYDVNWFKFTVVPEPASLTLLAMGGLALIRRRRA